MYDANLRVDGVASSVGSLHAFFGVFDGHNGAGANGFSQKQASAFASATRAEPN